MDTKYTRDYFIEKFRPIPETEWCIYSYNRDGGSCALGHCGYPIPTSEGRALITLFGGGQDVSGAFSKVSEINDGADPRYTQPTPRARILAALEDLPS